MSELTSKKCVPCEGFIKPFTDEDEDKYNKEVKEWKIKREGIHKIKRSFTFETFMNAIEFVNKVAEIAESEGHHPDIYIYYNKVTIELHTHAIKGLFLNDFIVAAKLDEIYSNL